MRSLKKLFPILGTVLMVILVAGCTQPSPVSSPTEIVQASYLDLTGNIADLRSRVTEWQKGDEGSLAVAREKLARAQILVAHPLWPESMAEAIGMTESALQEAAAALKTENVTLVDSVYKRLGDGSHDVTHAYYGDWMPTAPLVGTSAQGRRPESKPVSGGHGDSHGADASTGHALSAQDEGPNWLILGGFLGTLALIIGAAAITRPQTLARIGGDPEAASPR